MGKGVLCLKSVYFLDNDGNVVDQWFGCSEVEYIEASNSIKTDKGIRIGYRGEIIVVEEDKATITSFIAPSGNSLKPLDVKDECLPPNVVLEKQKQTIQQQEDTINHMQQLLLQLQNDVSKLKQNSPSE